MSNYELHYYEMDTARKTLSNARSKTSSVSGKLKYQSTSLIFSNTSVTREVRRQLNDLANLMTQQTSNIDRLKDCLTKVMDYTDDAEIRASGGGAIELGLDVINDFINEMWGKSSHRGMIGIAALAVGKAISGKFSACTLPTKAIFGIPSISAEAVLKWLSKSVEKRKKVSILDLIGGGLEGADNTFDILEILGKGGKKVPVIGAGVEWASEFFNHTRENFTDNDTSTNPFIESAVEGLVGATYVGVGVATGAVVTAAAATAGIVAVGAPAIAVGVAALGAGVLVQKGLDGLSRLITGNDKGFIENVGDGIINAGKSIGKNVSDFAKKAVKDPVGAACDAVGNVAKLVTNPFGAARKLFGW